MYLRARANPLKCGDVVEVEIQVLYSLQVLNAFYIAQPVMRKRQNLRITKALSLRNPTPASHFTKAHMQLQPIGPHQIDPGRLLAARRGQFSGTCAACVFDSSPQEMVFRQMRIRWK